MEAQYKVADGNPLRVLGQFEVTAELDGKAGSIDLMVVVTNVPQLNLFGRQAMAELELIDLTGHFMQHMEGTTKLSVGQLTMESSVGSLQNACKQCCQEFPDLFKPELGCLKNSELKVKFKPEPRPKCGSPLTSIPMEPCGSSAKGNSFRTEQGQDQGLQGLLSNC